MKIFLRVNFMEVMLTGKKLIFPPLRVAAAAAAAAFPFEGDLLEYS